MNENKLRALLGLCSVTLTLGLLSVVMPGLPVLAGLSHPSGQSALTSNSRGGLSLRATVQHVVLPSPTPTEVPYRGALLLTAETRVTSCARCALAPVDGSHRLDRPASVGAGEIERVLASYNSPAVGTGLIFYDLGAKYGIDPAYALAFYIAESDAGTKGVARFTHGIGNIRTTPGYADYEGYRSYPSYAEGIEDWYKLIAQLYMGGWGLRTPEAILPRYAPAADHNNPGAYAATVNRLVASWQGAAP